MYIVHVMCLDHWDVWQLQNEKYTCNSTQIYTVYVPGCLSNVQQYLLFSCTVKDLSHLIFEVL